MSTARVSNLGQLVLAHDPGDFKRYEQAPLVTAVTFVPRFSGGKIVLYAKLAKNLRFWPKRLVCR